MFSFLLSQYHNQVNVVHFLKYFNYYFFDGRSKIGCKQCFMLTLREGFVSEWIEGGGELSSIVFTFPSETHTAWVCWSRMVSFKLPYQASLAEFRSITANRQMEEGDRERERGNQNISIWVNCSLGSVYFTVFPSATFNHLVIFELESVSMSVFIDMCQSQYLIATLYCNSPDFGDLIISLNRVIF